MCCDKQQCHSANLPQNKACPHFCVSSQETVIWWVSQPAEEKQAAPRVTSASRTRLSVHSHS